MTAGSVGLVGQRLEPSTGGALAWQLLAGYAGRNDDPVQQNCKHQPGGTLAPKKAGTGPCEAVPNSVHDGQPIRLLRQRRIERRATSTSF